MSRSQAWCFTLNNYTEDELPRVQGIDCSYLTYGKEVGQEGTPHLQGYIRFKTKKSLSQVKELLPRAHLETSNTVAAAIKYCHKEDKEPFEKGDRPLTQDEKGILGKRVYDETLELAKQGRLEEVDSRMLIKYHKTLKDIAKDYMQKPSDAPDTTGQWYYGVAGAGKSRQARLDHPNAYFKLANKWWDGYQGEPAVIIDDIDRNHSVLGHHLKIWGDRYSFLAESKGSASHIRPAHIIITSQYHPSTIWPDAETRDAILRRYTLKLIGEEPIVSPSSDVWINK